MDLAAGLGVTTQALSQTIRIATLGDIDQNAAKFSLSDRQIPIRVLLSEDSRRSLATIENLPVPTSRGTTVPLQSVAERSEEPTSELQSLMRNSYAVFCLKKKKSSLHNALHTNTHPCNIHTI